MVLEHSSRAEAATQDAMLPGNLGDWVHRYSVEGVVELVSRTMSGRALALRRSARADAGQDAASARPAPTASATGSPEKTAV